MNIFFLNINILNIFIMKENYNTIKHVIINEYGNDVSSITNVQIDATETSSTYYKSVASKISEKYIKSDKVASIFIICSLFTY